MYITICNMPGLGRTLKMYSIICSTLYLASFIIVFAPVVYGYGSNSNFNKDPLYLGCFRDEGLQGLLNHELSSDNNMTLERCFAHCHSVGYQKYAALLNSKECRCGSRTGIRITLFDTGDNCNSPCSGNRLQKCGGALRISMFDLEIPASIRLIGGLYQNEGLVEVLVDGEWGAICNDNFGSAEAKVVCRQLQLYNGIYVDVYSAGYVSRSVVYDKQFYDGLDCVGYEAYVSNCFDYSEDGCSTSQFAGVRCDFNADVTTTEGTAFNFLAWIGIVIFFSIVFGVVSRRYRQRQGCCGSGPVQQQLTTQVYNANNVTGTIVPPATTTTYPPPPTGSYPTQSQPYPNPAATNLPPQYNTVVPPQGYPQPPPGAAAYPTKNTSAPYPPMGGNPNTYPYQNTSYPSAPPPDPAYPPPGYPPASYPNPAYPQPDHSASPAFPPSDYVPVTDNSTPDAPPPSYEDC